MNHNINQLDTNVFIKQLEYIDQNIQELTRLYMLNTPVPERIEDFFNLYVSELEAYVESFTQRGVPREIPKVFIGTKVSVLFDGDNDPEVYHICLPKESNPDEGRISFLSPVGRQLLLRKLGEEVLLRTPSGEVPVRIQQIAFNITLED
ncbi:GreA/GreB family elongation factor [Fredinandcohnia sp. 179-A 10B2 NHS]|uniref:GreA/GreB family elongation factor n=1 Tax=Fredinandcohnia sp. 179-A 10B2 NHS TaxID=3235176 RepID=UPI0039A2C75E